MTGPRRAPGAAPPRDPSPLRADPWLVTVGAGLAAAGALALVVGCLVAGLVVPGHDPIADTVSDLAAGRSAWIMDFSLYGYTAGLIGLALAAADRRLDGARWTAGVLTVALLGLLVTVIGARDEYGDGQAGGPVVHIHLVYALAACQIAAPLAMARGLARTDRLAARVSKLAAGIWVCVGPLFFAAPTGFDGLIERSLGATAAIWVALVASAMIRSALRDEREAAGAAAPSASFSRRTDRDG